MGETAGCVVPERETGGMYPNLTSLLLPDEASGHRIGLSGIVETKSLDVRVRRDALRLGGRLDLFDLHPFWCLVLSLVDNTCFKLMSS